MRRFLMALFLGPAMLTAAAAQDAVPDRRIVVTQDVDFYGSDLQALFDTTLDACRSACLDNPDCKAFTFNRRSNACFPKSAVTERQPFEGAVSARVEEAVPGALDRAAERRAELDFLRPEDLASALAEAMALAMRHAGGEWGTEALLDAAAQSRAGGDLATAIHWTGAALAQTDRAEHWLQYGQWSADHAATRDGADERRFRDRAFLAAINAYLRAEDPGTRQTALHDLARALEATGRGREMIAPLRLAESLGARRDIAALLDEAVGKYGFRITDHRVESDSATPRLCAEFSEPLIRAGQDYTPYVRLPDPRLAVTAQDNRICVAGMEHGARLTITFRAGLPAASGETLLRDVPVTAYMRDRTPTVAFPGRAYVLPKGPDAGVPILTVNLDKVDLVLRRVADRNLVRAVRESWFGQPLRVWEERVLADEIAEEIWRGTGQVQNTLNADMTTRLPVGALVGDLPAGVYALSAAVPEADEYDERRATQWFILSDIGLTTMQGNDGLTVFARALSDATPMAGLSVSLVSVSNRVLETAVTDAEGIARFGAGLLRGTGGAEPALLLAEQGETDFALLSLTDPAFDLSDRGVAGRAPAGPVDAFLTTDRGAYRAGEVIHATALARDAQALAVTGLPVTAILTRPDGVEHSRHISTEDRAGGHVFALPLAPSVPRGTWRLAVFGDVDAPALASRTLLVEDFVPERIDFDLALPEGPINPLVPPRLDVTARYLFGTPGAGLSAEGEVTLSTETTLETMPRFRFGRHDAQRALRTETLPADLVTDAEGRLQLALPLPEIEAEGRPLLVRATLRLSEASGRPVEREVIRSVAPPTAMIGIRPAFDDTLPEGAEARFDVIALGPDMQPQEMAIRWQVNRVTTRYQWYQLYGNWNWEPVTTRETVARGEGLLGAGTLPVTAEVDWGAYEIVVERTDGAYVSASMAFEAGWYAPASATDTPDMLEMSLDKPAYRPGETATLRMVPRHAGTALVTVLADRVISMQAIDVAEGGTTLQLPVTDDWGAGVYVSAQVIRPMDVAAGQNPARALGLAHAAVDPGDAKLAVAFDAPAETDPRGPLTAAIQIANLSEGETAFVTVAAVDLGILNLTGFETPDPADHYFGQRRLGVEIRDLYGRLIDGMSGAMGNVRSGGDGAAGMRMQAPPPTEDLVAFFSGPVQVDATGRARVLFDMPDFNGTVRLMAVAWSARGVGAAEADVLVRDPVVISATLPRFLAPGDASRLLLELTHTRGPAGEMALGVTADGVALAPEAIPASVSLGEGGKAVVSVPLTAGRVGDHQIDIALTTPDGRRVTKTLAVGIRALDPPTGATRRLTLEPGQTFTLDDAIFAGLRQDQASAVISAGPLARFDVPGMLTSLDRYPYGCTEQVTSQALPLLYLSSVAEPLGLGDAERIDLRIDQAITRILTRQAANGAFGLWRAESGDFWLDAYVTDFLARAAAAGHDVPGLALGSALDNLANRIAYAPEFDEGGEDIAYALMVLAREGRAAMGDLRYYADEKADAFATPLAQAQLGAALAAYGDQGRADRMFAKAAARISGQAVADSRIWRADYGTTARDAAGVLTLAVEARSDLVDRPALVDLVTAPRRFRSTQEQAWALMAAHAMVRDPAVSGLSVNGRPWAGPFVQRVERSALDPMTLTNTATTQADITLTTFGLPEGATGATGYGYTLERSYFTIDGQPLADGPIPAGTRLIALLTVRPAEDTQARLMIDDALPAGFEIDNPSLLRSGDVSALDLFDLSEAENAEFRTERFLAAVNQSGRDPIRLAYMLRAVSPGTFHHPAALVEDMYRPEFRATTASGRVTIAP